MSTLSKKLNLHEWSKEDTIICLYITKFGNKGMYLKTDSEIAKFIGSSVGSLKMQCSNIRTLLGHKNNSLSDFSNLQKSVFEEYGNLTQIELLKVVKTIIKQDDFERIEILRKMGKDPSKFSKIN
jgi:hypothetical protein